MCSACLLPNSENIEGRRARERNHREKTICKQMIARIFVQEAVCSDRMIYFSCIPRRMKCLLDQSQHLFLSFSLLCSLTMCTFPFKKERKKSTVKYGWCMLYCVVHREASSTWASDPRRTLFLEISTVCKCCVLEVQLYTLFSYVFTRENASKNILKNNLKNEKTHAHLY